MQIMIPAEFSSLYNFKLIAALDNFKEFTDLGFNSKTKISEIFKKYDFTDKILSELQNRIDFAPKVNGAGIIMGKILEYDEFYDSTPVKNGYDIYGEPNVLS